MSNSVQVPLSERNPHAHKFLQMETVDHKDIITTLGNRIRTARLARNLTQRQLGERVGTSQQNISHIELGAPLSDGSQPATSERHRRLKKISVSGP